MSGPLLVPACTFLRVFDTEPVQEVLTLPELTAALRRFEIKTQTAAKIEREVARIQKGRAGLEAGEPPRGKFMGKLHRAMEAAAKAGEDPRAALAAEADKMIVDARKGAKRDLRLWSPALYRPGADKRGSENVTHVSCLVLDYDDGTAIAEASTTWSAWFHLVYTTWSHTPEHPRFRLVMPLAFSVPAEDWAAVWSWAEAHAHFTIDPSMKSPAATYALPAVPSRDWPREAFSRPGAILDPVDEGILTRRAALDLEPRRPPEGVPSAIRGEDPEKEYVDHEDPEAVYFVDEVWEEDWEAPPELVAAVQRGAAAPGASGDGVHEVHETPGTVTSGDPGDGVHEVHETPGTVTSGEAGCEVRPGAETESEAGSGAESGSGSGFAAGDGGRGGPSPQPPPASGRGGRAPDDRAGSSVASVLERLVGLHREGWLTEKELSLAKRRVLEGELPGEPRRVGKGKHRRTICVDFDGVIHSYVSGWKGAVEIPDPPVDGAIDWLTQAAERFDLAITSVRNAHPGGVDAMRAWLRRHGLPERGLARLRFPSHKPPAELYIDDRGYRFVGTFPSFEELGALEPWTKKR